MVFSSKMMHFQVELQFHTYKFKPGKPVLLLPACFRCSPNKPLLLQSNEDVSSTRSAKCHTCLWLPFSYACMLPGYHASPLPLYLLSGQSEPAEHTGEYPAASNQQLCHGKSKSQTALISKDFSALKHKSSTPVGLLKHGRCTSSTLLIPSHLTLSTYSSKNHSSQHLQHPLPLSMQNPVTNSCALPLAHHYQCHSTFLRSVAP